MRVGRLAGLAVWLVTFGVGCGANFAADAEAPASTESGRQWSLASVPEPVHPTGLHPRNAQLAVQSAAPPEPMSASGTGDYVCPSTPGFGSGVAEGPGGWPGQSNTVPLGYPTPTSHTERLTPGYPPRDPGPFDWARPGPYIASRWPDFAIESFDTTQRLVTTYYFYWHYLTDPARRVRYDSGAFKSPPNPDRYSFLFADTHLREFEDMLAAGIDFVLPVYWGEPGHPGRTTGMTCPHYWSTDGIPPMVEALDILAERGTPLKMGLFYDTTIMANADLRTPSGKEYFYLNVRDYFSRIPPRHWAAMGGKPVVWLYDSIWVTGFDQSSFDYLADRFAQDFGGRRPFIVRELQWHTSRGPNPPHELHSDGLYAWGAAVFGYNPGPRLTIAQVGPGFTNTVYCTGGAARNCFDVDREGGAFYERNLQAAVASSRQILAIETWNEFSEGSQVAETREDGRRYIELTRAYADQFKLGTSGPALPP
jgi:hypothetical protein